MTYFLDFLSIINALALLLALVFLLLGPSRKFWIFLVYILSELVVNLGLAVADFMFHGSAGGSPTAAQIRYSHLYWTSNVYLDLLRFLLVILLINRAASGTGARPAVSRILGVVVAATLVLPFVLFHPTFTPWPRGPWFNSTSELLNFGAAIMNLLLWGTLIASRQRDPQLLRVSAGLGIVVTGAAIAYGLRHFIPPGTVRLLPNLFLMFTQLTGWIMWCSAFRNAPKPDRTVGSSPVATVG